MVEQVSEQACLMGGWWHPTAHECGSGQHNVGDGVGVGKQCGSIAAVHELGFFDKDKAAEGGVVVRGSCGVAVWDGWGEVVWLCDKDGCTHEVEQCVLCLQCTCI